jgi:hypothetical protein
VWYKHLIIKYYSRWNGAVPAETLGSAEGVGLESISRGKSHDPECNQCARAGEINPGAYSAASLLPRS